MTPSRWRQIEEMHQAALRLGPSERSAFLNSADPELRHEVEALLQQRNVPEDATMTVVGLGAQLGPYKIEASIGKGGMGEVFRAIDTRLSRKVAIKTSNKQFDARFEREARAISSLNHPHICTLYDVGPSYLVMELVEGETLAARIKKGKLSISDALRYGSQIASALAEAHSKGITHRDLKPGNVMLAKNGVKVLDFGLAKLHTHQDDGLTQDNAVMGTPAYMAPEQREGKECDARTDIYALGLILCEMVTGKRVEQQQTPLDHLPEKLRHAIERCIEPDPDSRWQSAADLRAELEWAGKAPPEASLAQARKREARWLWPAASAILLAASVTLAVVHFRETAPLEQTLRYTVATPEGSMASFAISPDGRNIAIAVEVKGERQLWLRAMDALQAQPIPFTDDATFPFWSPDSRHIGFFAQGKLKRVAASGGPAQSLCDAPLGHGGAWSRDGVILFAPNNAGVSIKRVAETGGDCVDVTKTKGALWGPEFLPDGRHFLYLLTGVSTDKEGIYVSSLDGSETRRVLADVSRAVVAPPAPGAGTGHILFSRASTLMALPFEASNGEVSGDPFPVVEGVTNGMASISERGVLVYRAGDPGGSANQIGWYDRTGKSLGPVSAPGRVTEPSISPDEKSVVFSRGTSSGFDLWVRDLSRGTETRFTSDPSNNGTAFWSPLGDRIAFVSNRGGRPYNLYEKAANGSGQEQLLLPSSVFDNASQWSRDGRYIVYNESDPKNKWNLWVLPMNGGTAGKPIAFLQSEFDELYGQLSPDSQWMAFTSDRSGRREVYVRPFPAGDGEWPISIAGGQGARWRGDGKELFFEAADGKMMAVPVKTAVPGPKAIFDPGLPVALFDAHISHNVVDFAYDYDVTSDGRRFLINTTEDPRTTPLTVVTNWRPGAKK